MHAEIAKYNWTFTGSLFVSFESEYGIACDSVTGEAGMCSRLESVEAKLKVLGYVLKVIPPLVER